MTREEAIRILSQYDVSAIQFYETDGREISWNKGHEALDVAISALEQPEIIHCEDCEWWEKQKDSLQGRCELMQMYPTGAWYCGNAQRRVTDG